MKTKPKAGKFGEKFGEKGSVALEYILVTTFAAALTLAMIGLTKKILQEKIQETAQALGLEIPEIDWSHLGLGTSEGES